MEFFQKNRVVYKVLRLEHISKIKKSPTPFPFLRHSRVVVMPGNKNSGRKKSFQSTSDLSTVEETPPSEMKRKAGRPRASATPCQSTLLQSVSQDDLEQESTPTTDDAEKSCSVSSCPINLLPPSSHHANLKKRTSECIKFHDEHLGTTLDNFPASKLPQNRTVLQRY